MPSGRPTKLTSKLQTQLCDVIAQGNTVTCATSALGMGTSAFYNWMRRGEAAIDIIETGKEMEPGEEIYVDFVHAVKKATIEAEQRCIITIMAATRDHWQAAAWWLERRIPENYARRDNLNVSSVSLVGGLPELTEEQEGRIKQQLALFFAHRDERELADTEESDGPDG